MVQLHLYKKLIWCNAIHTHVHAYHDTLMQYMQLKTRNTPHFGIIPLRIFNVYKTLYIYLQHNIIATRHHTVIHTHSHTIHTLYTHLKLWQNNLDKIPEHCLTVAFATGSCSDVRIECIWAVNNRTRHCTMPCPMASIGQGFVIGRLASQLSKRKNKWTVALKCLIRLDCLEQR